ncbi:hypothetical protein CC77DRAFT_834220 [Alternaria alternata]|uniref:Uncharacterized protein n=1 Tax=Alternaria alternata TaxID=5599 RepID=A0A177DSJ4_ALTAL|nr:hypothetical protein CC77DRAFT_834220 [Alternaria alternata]OAG21699.1 hypothetical protein CC77DRAFT_834220 [Alternaria alternata]
MQLVLIICCTTPTPCAMNVSLSAATSLCSRAAAWHLTSRDARASRLCIGTVDTLICIIVYSFMLSLLNSTKIAYRQVFKTIFLDSTAVPHKAETRPSWPRPGQR